MCPDSRVASLHASLVLLGPIFVYTVNFGTSKTKGERKVGTRTYSLTYYRFVPISEQSLQHNCNACCIMFVYDS